MIVIFFFYGLCFFLLGIAIFLYPKKGSSFQLAPALWLIAAFGILHGIDEWIDMFTLIRGTEAGVSLRIAGLILTGGSFFFLALFGATIATQRNKRYRVALKFALYLSSGPWIIIIAFSHQPFTTGDIWARYLFGLPGALLTSYALISELSEFERHHVPAVKRYLKISASAFLAYGLFAGLIVPQADFFPASILNYPTFSALTGIPVQVFRAFCAAIIAYSMIRVLAVFDWEIKVSLRDSNKALGKAYEEVERRVRERTVELNVAKEKMEKLSHQNELILNSAGEGIYVMDLEGKTTFVNPATERMVGWKVNELIGKKVHNILHHTKCDGMPYPPEECRIYAAYRDRNVHHVDDEVFWRKDGTSFPVEYTSTPIVDDGTLYGAVVTFRDITYRKHAEQQIQQQVQRLAALHDIDIAITSSLDLRVSTEIILDEVIKQLHVDAADILLLDQHKQSLEYAGSRGFRTNALKHTNLRMGQGYAGHAALERRTIRIPNLSVKDTDFARAPLLAEEGFVEYFSVPLISKGHIKGVIEIFHRSPLNPDQGWLDFMEALGTQAAIAIDNAEMFNDLERSNTELILAYDTTLEGWSRALDYRDKETEGHSQRVTEMTLKIARAVGLSKEEMIHVRRGALLHDIGKLGVPDSILLKPGKLTDEEMDIMKKHTTIAYEMLSPISFLRQALDIPYCHHEKWDGTGYPRGLKGEQIPLAARIFAIVDVRDALRSDRPYRPAWPKEKTMEHIVQLSGSQFDPKVVEVFMNLMKSESA
jgi:PAS domain S-box-containing protein/putative nucleotidyltransferase with HDIG domain